METSISVVVPVHNGERTIGACLQALLASTQAPHEIVVVDDGSTDTTRQLLLDLAREHAPKLRVVPLDENIGAARAKNVGASEATGEVLFFTDADVYVRSDTLALIAQVLANADIDGVVGLLSENCLYRDFASSFKNFWMHYTYRRQPRRVGLFFTSAAAIRRSIFEREDGFDSHYAGASITEDIEFGQRLLSAGYMVVLDKRLTVYHDKHYTLKGVLRTDLYRARGLIQTWIRNRVSHSGRTHYASVPWFFGAGVGALGLATLCLLLALVTWQAAWLWGMLGCVVTALAFNAPFLTAIYRWQGVGYTLKSMAFLLADLYVSGLGIVLGMVDSFRGVGY